MHKTQIQEPFEWATLLGADGELKLMGKWCRIIEKDIVRFGAISFIKLIGDDVEITLQRMKERKISDPKNAWRTSESGGEKLVFCADTSRVIVNVTGTILIFSIPERQAACLILLGIVSHPTEGEHILENEEERRLYKEAHR